MKGLIHENMKMRIFWQFVIANSKLAKKYIICGLLMRLILIILMKSDGLQNENLKKFYDYSINFFDSFRFPSTKSRLAPAQVQIT